MKSPSSIPHVSRARRLGDFKYDEANRSVLKALKETASATIGDSPFTVRPGISAEEALLHVSMLLKSAEEVSDEITEHASGIERGLIWSLVHSVEMARGVVDALLDGNRL
ncbi:MULTISPECIES: DUF6124 family protein [Pseudomonas]|uniref:DUF6124 family protein n=1 Tax=Pseudomonas TaxID=286 RepID=UPI000497B950|nr:MULTISPECIES: hypothetical protein [Pseudomonas]UUT25206.1 hypothetical protein NRG23_14860 [Pseudomonas sp. T8]